MRKIQLHLVTTLLAMTLILAGCAQIAPLFEPMENPRLSITSLKVLPANGIEQRIEIGLHILNPNPYRIETRGLYMEVGFNDIPVLRGVASQIPPVEAYAEADTSVTLATSLVNGIRLVKSVMEHPDEPLRYRVEARLDLSSPYGRHLTLTEHGEMSPRAPGTKS